MQFFAQFGSIILANNSARQNNTQEVIERNGKFIIKERL